MNPEITPLLVGLFAYIGAASATPMFEPFNRPEIFRRGFGEALFGVLNLIIFIGSVSLIVWSFIHVTWYVAAGLLVAGVVAGTFACRIMPLFLMSAMGPLIAGLAILSLHYLAWFSAK
jgi:hypothetical protein